MNEVKTSKATAKTVRITSRKVRLVIDLVRGKQVDEALAILDYTNKSSSPVVSKVIKSAAANAVNNLGADPAKLYISKIFADEGATMKRFRPQAKGSAHAILKRTSHITVEVSEKL